MNVFKLHLTVPVLREKILASAELLCASDRFALMRHRIDDAWLLNTTLYSRNLAPGLELPASVYNVLDQKYRTPGGVERLQDNLVQDGRTFRFKFTYRF